jgi:hypothetical protein
MHSTRHRSLPKLTVGALLAGAFALAAVPAFAAAATPGAFPRPAVVGQVTAISGSTLTVATRAWQRDTDDTSSPSAQAATYAVDASGATVTKGGQASTVSAIAVGDMVAVEGTVSGQSVTATSIRDGAMRGMRGVRADGDWRRASTMPWASKTPPITGNGEPIIGGTVTAISGSTLTVTPKTGAAYMVTTTSATTFSKRGVTGATLSNVAVGDSVVVQGTVSGQSVAASSVLDQGAPPSTTISADTAGAVAHPGFFGMLGGFFTRLFGFF